MLLALLAMAAGAGAPAAHGDETAADVSTRALLEQLEERKMPDVILWVLDRVAADPAASAGLKAEVSFRRALALVASSRTEADSKKRAAVFDEAQKLIDGFLATTPEGRQAIDAYTQKGNLLIERGRLRLEQAKRPGADKAALLKEAIGFFDEAIKTLEGKIKPGEEIKKVDNAEDAVVKEWREAKAKVAALKPKEPPKDDKKGPKKPPKRDPAQDKELERLENDVEALQAKLVQTRLMVASAYFEKARAYDEKSTEWTAALEKSTEQFEEIADKYPTLGGGLLARYYQGRNLATLGKRGLAVQTLANLVAIGRKDPSKKDETPRKLSPLEVMLRSKALVTSLECWLADEKYDAFDPDMRDFVVETKEEQKVLKLAPLADQLALKYWSAKMLKAQADSLPPKDTKGDSMRNDARKLATEVAMVNRDFADEAQELLKGLGKGNVEGAEKDFNGIVQEAKLALATMQERQVEAKKLQSEGKDAAAAVKAAAAARDEALATFDKALAVAAEPPAKDQTPPPEQAVNYARYMRTFLLYDAKRYAEAADVGVMLVEQFPNAMGSRQAGMIAMASLQQLVKGGDAAVTKAANEKLQGLARSIARIWPTEKEGSDAMGVLVSSAIDARNPQTVIDLIEALPANAAARPSLLARAGTFLWREVMEQGRADEAGRAPAATVAAWKGKARGYLDESLKSPSGTGTALRSAVAAALARCQIALDDGDAKAAVTILENPTFGPWTVVNDPKADATLREGSFAEAALTVALRSFIQAGELDKAQQAMDGLEKLAGSGDAEEKSARLTAMYFAMGQELQQQLERLCGGGDGADAAAREKAVSILDGFEKFLDGLARRDPKVSSQIWVATTYLTLGSGKGTGAVVPRPKAEQYLDRAADVYKQLLERKDEPDVAKFEPSIRLKMASIYRERGRWDDAQEQIDWILSDAKRQNSLDTQVQAAEILQATGQALAATNAAAAEAKFREATAGRTGGPIVIWGWGGLAGKVGRQAFVGNDDKALKARELFFTARLNQARCLLARAQLAGKSPAQVTELLSKANDAVALTRKMYPDLGGPAMQARFEKLLKEIQKQQGAANPRGFAELDEKAAAPAAAATVQ